MINSLVVNYRRYNIKIKCKKFGCSDFSTLENNYEEFYYNSGTGRVIKELECDNCRTVYRVNMEIEIKDVDMY